MVAVKTYEQRGGRYGFEFRSIRTGVYLGGGDEEEVGQICRQRSADGCARNGEGEKR